MVILALRRIIAALLKFRIRVCFCTCVFIWWCSFTKLFVIQPVVQLKDRHQAAKDQLPQFDEIGAEIVLLPRPLYVGMSDATRAGFDCASSGIRIAVIARSEQIQMYNYVLGEAN